MIIEPKKIIINKRQYQTPKHKALSLALFLMFWGGLLYLMRPLIAIVGWGLAYYIFDTVSTDAEGAEVVRTIITDYLPWIILLSLSLASWSLYNWLRFRGFRDKRRVPQVPLTLDEIAGSTPLDPGAVREIRTAPVTIFYFDENGEIKDVEACDDAADADLALAAQAKAEQTKAALLAAEDVLAALTDEELGAATAESTRSAEQVLEDLTEIEMALAALLTDSELASQARIEAEKARVAAAEAEFDRAQALYAKAESARNQAQAELAHARAAQADGHNFRARLDGILIEELDPDPEDDESVWSPSGPRLIIPLYRQ